MTFGPLSNDLVTLKPLVVTDYEALYLVGSDPQIWAQHPDINRYTKEGFKFYFDKLMETDEPYLIIRNEDHAIIGATSFYEKEDINRTIAIGYTFLSKCCWGGFYNSSLKKLMIDTAFTYYDKVVFHVRDNNLRSQSALVKIGARREQESPTLLNPTISQYKYVINKTLTS